MASSVTEEFANEVAGSVPAFHSNFWLLDPPPASYMPVLIEEPSDRNIVSYMASDDPNDLGDAPIRIVIEPHGVIDEVGFSSPRTFLLGGVEATESEMWSDSAPFGTQIQWSPYDEVVITVEVHFPLTREDARRISLLARPVEESVWRELESDLSGR